LIACYENEELKPTVIEAIGNICSPKSQDFLLKVMKSEDDVFYRTSAIDSLAVCGDDIEICRAMIQQMTNESEELQFILLRTIYAISYRLQEFLELPTALRHIAQNALLQTDSDVRYAGLIALGSYYIDSDIPGLINEAMQNNSQSQRHILHNLIANSAPRVVQKFFVLYCSSSAPDGTDIEFISHLPSLWSSVAEENKRIIIETIVDIAFTFPKGYSSEIIELVSKVQYEYVLDEIRKKLQSDNTEYVDNAMDIVRELKFKEIAEQLVQNSYQSKRLNLKAATIADELANI
jgi:hypothetical protein